MVRKRLIDVNPYRRRWYFNSTFAMIPFSTSTAGSGKGLEVVDTTARHTKLNKSKGVHQINNRVRFEHWENQEFHVCKNGGFPLESARRSTPGCSNPFPPAIHFLMTPTQFKKICFGTETRRVYQICLVTQPRRRDSETYFLMFRWFPFSRCMTCHLSHMLVTACRCLFILVFGTHCHGASVSHFWFESWRPMTETAKNFCPTEVQVFSN